ncbi:hypothetical protein C8J56DRAFT_796160 [Mycena floridula]|nr:hypothetical protein C8J56DRAFT_796160 [Mycena floridula]
MTPESAQKLSTSFYPRARRLLCTKRVNCMFCTDTDSFHTLRRREKLQVIQILDIDLTWIEADLCIAHCITCKADYLPDKVTYKDETGQRVQKFELDTEYFRISKNGLWAHRRVAVLQEKALLRFHSGWSNFAQWLNDGTNLRPKVTNRQCQRLFLEYFSRRLIVAHNLTETFTCPANPSSSDLAECLRNTIGRDGGVLGSSMDHGCLECTRWKRFPDDLIAEGLVTIPSSIGVAGVDEEPVDAVEQEIPLAAVPANPIQPSRNAGEPRGYIRQAVMDGKNMGHRKCALDICTQELVDYRNGRFCQDHSAMNRICGIIPCGQPVHSPGARTCSNLDHKRWEAKYSARFARLSFPGVQRVVRRQQANEPTDENPPHHPRLNPISNLPALGDVPGDRVAHTFRAKSVYCVQTIQWACGVPIGWGKCYRSESPSQVLQILKDIWEQHPRSRPSFLVYDDACDLLRHIVTQEPNSPWVTATRLIVDAWHYIGHQAIDVLCRTRCNPAPLDGSQPDLILAKKDDNGQVHTTRAFNTETAEQFNSWLTRFEAQLKQMTARNYDVFMHVLFLLYKELREAEIAGKKHELTDEFWQVVEGVREPEDQ